MYNSFTKPFTTSRYAHGELPVWSEIWEQFMLNQAYIYDPNNVEHNQPVPTSSRPEVILNGMDIYWRQPHRKLLLGWMANELNKLSFEDGRFDEIKSDLTEIVQTSLGTITEVRGLTFAIISAEDDQVPEGLPPVYTQLSPTTGKRSIFASSDPSVDMASLTSKLELVIILACSDDHQDTKKLVLRPDKDAELYRSILDKFLEPVRVYYDDPVGWKDDDYIPQPLRRRCLNLGVDPAL